MKKRVIASLLFMAMLVTMLPVQALATGIVTVSSSVTDLTMINGDITTITLTLSEIPKNQCYFAVSGDDIVSVEDLGWSSSTACSFQITATATGTGTLTFSLYEEATGYLHDTCNVTVCVAARTYTVSYNANGGSNAPSAQTKTEGIDLILSTNKPYWFGHNFLGWSTSSTSGDVQYWPSDTYWVDAGVTLHAVWEEAPVVPSTTGYEHINAAQIFASTYRYYQFTPTVSGYYRVISQAPALDLVAILYDSAGDVIGFDTDGGTFQIDYYLTGGETYYIQAGLRNSDSVEPFDFGISKASYITYNANGGSGAPSGHFVYYGNDAYLSSTVPTREGYTFCGWSADSNATSYDWKYAASEWVYIEEDTTLYAVWEVNAAGVIYNANGGDGAPGEQWMNYGDTFELYGDIPSRFGYNFLGWGTSADDTSASYQPGETITLNGNLYLYAVWEKAEVLTTPDDYLTEYTTIRYANVGTYYQLDCIQSGNYLFWGLETDSAFDNRISIYDSNGNEIVYDDDSGDNRQFYLEYYLTAGETYYILLGTYNNTYSYNFAICHGAQLTYDANGGDYAPDSHWVYIGNNPKLSTDVPGRDSYNFLGWATSSDATAAEYQPGDSYTGNVDVTLYAVWEHVTYNLIYDLDGGTDGPESVNLYGNVTIPNIIPEKLGYNFLGWSTGWGSLDYLPGDTIYVDGDLTLWALWEEKTVEDVAYYGAVSHTAEVTWPGVGQYYTFVPGSTGTYRIADMTDENVRLEIYNKSGTLVASSEEFVYTSRLLANQTYYLRLYFDDTTATGSFDFLIEKAYTVTYDANGGTGAPSSSQCYHTSGMTVSVTVPTRSGYVFLGWSEYADAEEAEYATGDHFLTEQDTTLYAVWIKNIVTIYYDSNGAGTAWTQEGVYGETVKLENTSPYWQGYNFLGWGTSPDAETVSYDLLDTVTLTEDMYLYAVWEKAPVLTTPSTYLTEYATLLYGQTWYQIDCTASGNYLFRGMETGEGFNNYIVLFDADGTLLASNDDSTYSNQFYLEYYLTAGETYFIRLHILDSASSFNFAIHHGSQLTYDANGGEDAPESHWVYSGFIPTLSTAAPSRDGYCNFLGWATSPDAAEPEYERGESYTANTDTTFYAVWADPTVIPSTTLCEYAEGKDSTPGAWWYQFTPTVSGSYLLEGENWCELAVAIYDEAGNHIGTADADSVQYPVDMEAGTTYYFKAMPYDSSVRSGFCGFYVRKGSYITYDANGGEYEISGQYVYYGSTGLASMLTETILTRAGYSFVGWSEDPNAADPSYWPGGYFTFTEDVTLYAVWTFNGATVYYDPNYDTGSTWTQLVTKYEPSALDSTAPEYPYHTFLGWATSPDATEPEYQPGDTVTLTEDLYLYALWEKDCFIVTFNANGGENVPEPYPMGSSTWYDVEAAAPHRLGCTFIGWSSDPNATAAEYSYSSSIKVQSDITLYAVWKTQELTADAVNSAYSAETCYPSTPVYFTFTPAEDSHYRLSSQGNYDTAVTILDSEGTVLATDDNSGTDGNFRIIHSFEAGNLYYIRIDITNITSAYASATLNQRRAYAMTYDMNDGSGVTEVQYKEHDISATISETVPTSEGRTFLGWATSPDATEPEYQPGDTYTANADVTLYAVWEQEETVLYGDVNSDGKVNAQDRLYLTRYLAGMTGYTEDMIDLIAADVNCDGKVNTQDRMILTRYLAQWTAYPELPHGV